MSSSAADSRNGMQAEKGRRNIGLELDAAIWSTLDDHLQEKIISRLPFKSLFQLAPSLSKTWRLKFGSASFQREIESSAISWKSYAPLLSYKEIGSTVVLFGYDSSSQRWCRLPTHSYIPRDMNWWWDVRAGNGSLLCWVGNPRKWGTPSSPEWVLVTNPLTRSWRELPPRPDMMINHRTVHVVLEESSEAYKVILGSLEVEDARSCLCIQIFDSTDGSWITKSYSVEGAAEEAFCHGIVVRGTVLYILVLIRTDWNLRARNKYKLIHLDMKEGTFEETPLQVVGQDEEPILLTRNAFIHFSDLLVCGSNLMVVIFYGEVGYRDAGTLSVFMLDLDRGLVIEVSKFPKKKLDTRLSVATCHGDCIYIGCRILKCGAESCHNVGTEVSYNVRTREWDWFHKERAILRSLGTHRNWCWKSITYQPGLNPFLKV